MSVLNRKQKDVAKKCCQNLANILSYQGANGTTILGTGPVCKNILSHLTIEEIYEVIRNLLVLKKNSELSSLLKFFEPWCSKRLLEYDFTYCFNSSPNPPATILKSAQYYFQSKKLVDKTGPSIEVDIAGGGIARLVAGNSGFGRNIEFGNEYCLDAVFSFCRTSVHWVLGIMEFCYRNPA